MQATSYFSWLDHSEHERRKMLDVIDLFREQDTRDELGLGAIRDAFADLLFPGTSTIQTRARYFLFVPWIYKGIEQRRLSGAEAAQRARRDELALVGPLAESGETEGVIGIEARGTLKRLPSSVYWQGLASWGIRLFPGSQERYHRSLESLYAARATVRRDDDGEPLNPAGATWDPRMPQPPSGFPRGISFALTPEEAAYLRERIGARCRRSLLAWLLEDGHAAASVAFPWDHPRAAAFPFQVQEQLLHARCFSEVMHGASLLYNLMLSEAASNADRTERYRESLKAWSTNLVARASEISAWDEPQFWTIVRSRGARVGPVTQSFVTRWVHAARHAGVPLGLVDDAGTRDLIHKREGQLKGEQARLDNRRALERWGGAAGAGQLAYRWGKAERIVADIRAGLGIANA